MAYQIGAMEIVLRTDLQQFTSGMRNAEQAVSQSSARMSRATEGATRSVGGLERALGNIHGADSFRALTISALRAEDSLSRLKSVALLIPSALGGVSVALGSRALIDYADTMTTIRNRISVVVDGQKERIRTEQEVFAIAQRTRSQFSATANLYARTTQAAENLGRSQADVLRFTEAVQKTNLISGSTTQESAAGAIQLAQGLASGRLQGDELRSILENNLELANILARELAGGDKGRLRELGSEGQLTANAVIDAVLRNLDRIDKKFAQSQPTIAQGFVLIDNAITKYVGDLDQALGATAAFVKILTSLSNSIPEAASALAGLGAVAASIFAGKIVSAAGSGISGAFTGAKTEVRQQGVAAFQAAIAAQRAREEANLRVVGAAEKVREGKASIFAAADPDAVRSFSAASEAMQRANSKLDAAVSERDRVAQQLDRINRQIAGAERQLSQAINSEAPQNARGLRSYFKAAFEVDAAKARAEAAAQAIVDAKQTRSDTMVGLSKTFLVGDPREQAKLETAMSRMDNLVAARERARIDAVNAIADAEKRAADEAARAVGAAEAAKSRAVQDALNQRRALIQQQAQAQAALESAGTRVSAASISQSFAQSALILNLLFSSFLPVPGAVFHAGGTVGGPSAMRLAPASLWNGAPRHHMGLNAGEHRAILKHGERVLTENDARRTDATMLGLARRARNDNAAGGAAGINVEIINNGGQVRTEPFRGDDGRQGLRVMFDTMFDERVSSGGADRVMGNRFGASPSRVRR